MPTQLYYSIFGRRTYYHLLIVKLIFSPVHLLVFIANKASDNFPVSGMRNMVLQMLLECNRHDLSSFAMLAKDGGNYSSYPQMQRTTVVQLSPTQCKLGWHCISWGKQLFLQHSCYLSLLSELSLW